MCPFIDVIDYETFEYRAQDEGARGAFDWDLYYKRLPLTEQDKASMPQPFRFDNDCDVYYKRLLLQSRKRPACLAFQM